MTPLRYGPRPAVPTKLDSYQDIITTRLAAYPELSAVRLLAEIRAVSPKMRSSRWTTRPRIAKWLL